MIYSIESIKQVCIKLHKQTKKIVLATGFFDLLHTEHINFLKKAKAAGDVLVVAVESDERARLTKGDGRPVETQSLRCIHILALTTQEVKSNPSRESSPLVDYVIALPDDFNNFDAYDSLMAAVRPQTYAVSGNPSHQKTKDFLVEKYGGHLQVVHALNPDISTTQILKSQNQL